MADANLTPEAEAHALLIRATAGDKSIVVPAVDDPAISAFAAELQKLRLQVTLVRSPSWAKGIKLRKKYAEISPALEEVIAGLREETAEALDQCSTANIDPMTWTGVNTVLAADEHRVTISKLEEFDAIRRWIDNNAFLQHPELLGAVDFWVAYAEHLAAIFAATVTRTGTNPPPVANPLYRFVAEVVPSVTGEKPSFQAVRSHFMRKRPVNWSKGGF